MILEHFTFIFFGKDSILRRLKKGGYFKGILKAGHSGLNLEGNRVEFHPNHEEGASNPNNCRRGLYPKVPLPILEKVVCKYPQLSKKYPEEGATFLFLRVKFKFVQVKIRFLSQPEDTAVFQLDPYHRFCFGLDPITSMNRHAQGYFDRS